MHSAEKPHPKAGQELVSSDGARYRIRNDGSWALIAPAPKPKVRRRAEKQRKQLAAEKAFRQAEDEMLYAKAYTPLEK